jgi:thioredoxin-like negative regulator of GroEL
MAKAIIEFNLNDPEDADAHYRCANALNLVTALWEIDNRLRSIVKYDSGETVEQFREEFYNILQENSINLDKLMG